jgi:4-hydroxy-tetrahydrodipicolinate reductase
MTHQALGLGLTEEQERQQYAPEFMEILYAPPMALTLSLFGETIDEFRHSRRVALATCDVQTAAGVIEHNSIVAVRRRIEGLVDGVERVAVEGYYWVGGMGQYPGDWLQPPQPGGYHMTVRGPPALTMALALGADTAANCLDAVIDATANRAVNAIPSVCEAGPGFRRFVDLPHLSNPRLIESARIIGTDAPPFKRARRPTAEAQSSR